MSLRNALAVAALVLAGCANDAPPPVAPPAPVAATQPVPSAPASPRPPAAQAPRVSQAPPPISTPRAAPPDQCGAYELAGLVGKPRTEIPVPLTPSGRRVVCTTCPKTMDYNPARLTIEYDARTGLVTKVGCN